MGHRIWRLLRIDLGAGASDTELTIIVGGCGSGDVSWDGRFEYTVILRVGGVGDYLLLLD